MLAQGEFTRFLNSKDDDKAEILEKITGVDIYSKIGAKVYELTDHKKKEWEDAKRIVEGTRTLTDTEIAEKQEALSALDNQNKEFKEGSDKDVAKRDWLNKDCELAKGRNDAANALRTANEAVESEDFKLREQTVNDWNATIDARLWMTEADKALCSQKKQTETLEALVGAYSTLLGGQKYAANEVDSIDAEIKGIEAFVSAEADKASVYENAQTIVGYLNVVDDGRKAVQKGRTDIASENKKLTDELTPAYEKVDALDDVPCHVAFAITGAIVVSTPQEVALADARKGISMFTGEKVNVPILGLVENMAWFTPAELPNNKYYLFGKEGCKRLAEEMNVPLLGQIPIVQSICEGGDSGVPVACDPNTITGQAFAELAKNVAKQVEIRNATMPETKKVNVTHK